MNAKKSAGGGKRATLHYGESLDDVGARFVDAWHRAQNGERVRETHLSFEDLGGLVSVLTPRRFDLLRAVHAHPAKDVRALSRALDRDYKNVHADMTALVGAGCWCATSKACTPPVT